MPRRGYSIRDDSRVKVKEVANAQCDFFHELSRARGPCKAPIDKAELIRLGLEAGIEEQMKCKLPKRNAPLKCRH